MLAKLDTDANQALAQAFQIRGIPAVKAFKDARLADEFVGVQGREEVERFFDGLLPSEADVLATSATEEDLRRALELEPGRPDAAVALARILIGRGEREEAIELLEPCRRACEADGLAARLRMQAEGLFPEALDGPRRGMSSSGASSCCSRRCPRRRTTRDEIRRAILGELDVLGPEDPLASSTRRRLAAALY